MASVIRGFVSPLIKVDQVSHTFGSQRALDRVSVTITPGEFVVVIGRSGAGKTTFLRTLSRAITVADGELRVGGADIGALHGRALRGYRAHVGMIYQQFNLVKAARDPRRLTIASAGQPPPFLGLTTIKTRQCPPLPYRKKGGKSAVFVLICGG